MACRIESCGPAWSRADVLNEIGRRRRVICAALDIDRHVVLFFSSHGMGSQSSTLFPSGSRIQANFPFSWDSGPFKISTPFRFSSATISDMLSIR